MSKVKKDELSEAAKKAGFEIVGNPPSGKFVLDPFGEVNLRAVSAKHAKILVDRKFPYLQKVTGKSAGK